MSDADIVPVKPEIEASGAGHHAPHMRKWPLRAAAEPDAFWAEEGQAHRLDQAADEDQEHQLHRRCLDQMVRGRHAERRGQLPGPASGRRAATRWRSSGRATTPPGRRK